MAIRVASDRGSVVSGISKPPRRLQFHIVVFISPAVLMLLFLLIVPLLQALALSFQVQGGWGIDNYVRAVTRDEVARIAFSNTVAFTAASTAAQYLIGLSLALLLNEKFPGRAPLRVVYLIPWMLPAVVSGITWEWMLDGQYGIFNEILVRLGIIQGYVAWLGDPGTALWGCIIANTWRGFPFMMVMLLAGLQAIPKELYEAAAVDGANAVRRFFHITMPSLASVSGVVLLLSWVSTFMNFALINVMTSGGPANSSEVLATRIYKEAIQFYEPAYAAALGILLMVLLMIPATFYVRATMRAK